MRLFTDIDMYEHTFPNKRYHRTLSFLEKYIDKSSHILDLGVANPFSEILKKEGFIISNTEGEDLDLNTTAISNSNADVVTAFEIFEHLVSPFTVLQSIKASKLVASVPLKLWFAAAYQHETDVRDRHFHEFEDWQFDWLLEKSGWRIVASEKWTNPVKKFGVRPILRLFTPRYYIVYAERISN